MSRFLAFILFSLAAWNWPLPSLDRFGTAALGLAFLALAVGAPSARLRRSLPFAISRGAVAAADEANAYTADLEQRIAAYDP